MGSDSEAGRKTTLQSWAEEQQSLGLSEWRGTLRSLMQGDKAGAAAARNQGWLSSKNEVVLFLDDDVTVDQDFLVHVRRSLGNWVLAGVVAFRVRNPDCGNFAQLVEHTVSLDRGPGVRCSAGSNLRLSGVWRYGAGAAMAVRKPVLVATKGFKEFLGAGLRHGGTEDAEFLWHSSLHGTVVYDGRVDVGHQAVGHLEALGEKMNEYGRGIGHLGALAGRDEGLDYVLGYCRHLLRVMVRPAADLGLTCSAGFRLKRELLVAITSTIGAYVCANVRRSGESVLCTDCVAEKR